jgi:hypothetical protein
VGVQIRQGRQGDPARRIDRLAAGAARELGRIGVDHDAAREGQAVADLAAGVRPVRAAMRWPGSRSSASI